MFRNNFECTLLTFCHNTFTERNGKSTATNLHNMFWSGNVYSRGTFIDICDSNFTSAHLNGIYFDTTEKFDETNTIRVANNWLHLNRSSTVIYYSLYMHSPDATLQYEQNTHRAGHLSLILTRARELVFDNSRADGITIVHESDANCETRIANSFIGFFNVKFNGCKYPVLDINHGATIGASTLDFGTSTHSTFRIQNGSDVRGPVHVAGEVTANTIIDLGNSTFGGFMIDAHMVNTTVNVYDNVFVGTAAANVIFFRDCHHINVTVNITRCEVLGGAPAYGMGFLRCTILDARHNYNGNVIRGDTAFIYDKNTANDNTIITLHDNTLIGKAYSLYATTPFMKLRHTKTTRHVNMGGTGLYLRVNNDTEPFELFHSVDFGLLKLCTRWAPAEKLLSTMSLPRERC